VPKLMQALREAGLADTAVIVGGHRADEDEQMLLDAGVARVFHRERRSPRSPPTSTTSPRASAPAA